MQFGPNLLHGRAQAQPDPARPDQAHRREPRRGRCRACAWSSPGEDFPGYTGLYLKDRRIFALDRVRFVGEPVAAVAADTPEIAEQALELIEVEYEALPGVFDPEFGASPEAPLRAPGPGRLRVRAVHLPAGGHQHLQLVQGAQGRHGRRAGPRRTWSTSTSTACRTSSTCRWRRTSASRSRMSTARSRSGRPASRRSPSAT